MKTECDPLVTSNVTHILPVFRMGNFGVTLAEILHNAIGLKENGVWWKVGMIFVVERFLEILTLIKVGGYLLTTFAVDNLWIREKCDPDMTPNVTSENGELND